MAIKILKEEPMMMAEVKDRLEKVKEKESELNFRAQKTLDHLQQFVHNSKQSKEAYDAVKKLEIPRLREQILCKIADILPVTENDVKACLQGSNVTVTADNMKKIADTVKEIVVSKK